MSGRIDLWPLEPDKKNYRIKLGAVVELNGNRYSDLSFQAPLEYESKLSNTCEPFVLASVFLAMKHSAEITVHGTVSPSLLRNLEEFQSVWANWVPERYSEIGIVAEHELEPEKAESPNQAIMAFSGGLDSCFTAYRHKNNLGGRQNCDIRAAVMVHGFDIPLNNERAFANAAAKAKIILDSIGIELILIKSNIKQKELDEVWEESHAAAIASCLTLFQTGFSCGLIAGSFPYKIWIQNIIYGSNPLTDPLLSSDSFKIIHDADMYGREEKLAGILSWPQAVENLRVCWEGEQPDHNCCKCEKCIRTILAFLALGIKPAKCFKYGITPQQIEAMQILEPVHLLLHKSLLTTARRNQIDEPWVRSLEKCIHRSERRLNGKDLSWKTIRSRVALRIRLKKLYRRYSNIEPVVSGQK